MRRVVVVRARRESGLYVLVWCFDRLSRGLESHTCGGSAVQGKGKE